MRTGQPLARSLMRTLSPLSLLPLLACSAPIDAPTLAEQAALHAREIVHQTGGGVSFTRADDSGLQKIVTGMSHAGDGLAGSMPSPIPPGMMSAMSGSAMAGAMAGMPSVLTTEEQFDDTADQLRTWLRERILADGNLESKSDDEATYLLHPEITCRALPRDGDPAGTVPALDTHCVDQLTKLQVRVVLRADGDGVRLTVQVGPDRLELSAFVIHSNLLAVETDLAKAYHATQYIDDTLGDASPTDMTRLETLAGRTRLALRKDGERKATFSASVLDAIHIATRDAAGAPGPEVKLGASDPTLAVSADGIAQSLTVKLNVGAMEVWGDWDPANTMAPNRDLHVAIGALTGETTFTESSDEIVARGLGIGATSVEAHGARIFELALNPNDMRRFDLQVTVDAAGQPHFQVTPRFDLALGFHLGLIAGETTNPPASYLLDETYGINLDAAGAPAAVQAVPATATFAGGLKVGAGTLTLSSTKFANPVVVPTGKCLTGVANPPADAHPLSSFAVVDCP
jgi:hypothetical protein